MHMDGAIDDVRVDLAAAPVPVRPVSVSRCSDRVTEINVVVIEWAAI